VEAKAFLVSTQNQLQQTSSHSLHYWKLDGNWPLDRLHKNSDTLQPQKVQSNAVKSVPKKTSVPSSSATASVGKNQSQLVLHNPNSVANIQRQLDPLAFDPTIKKLTS
jgi:hypothetical protein